MTMVDWTIALSVTAGIVLATIAIAVIVVGVGMAIAGFVAAINQTHF